MYSTFVTGQSFGPISDVQHLIITVLLGFVLQHSSLNVHIVHYQHLLATPLLASLPYMLEKG